MDLKEKTVIITGASSGLGAALAEKLADAGCELVLVAQNKNKLQAVCEKLSPRTPIAMICTDITADGAAEHIIQTAVEKFGKIDILVNNAGIWTDNDLELKDPLLVQKAFEVNSIGAIRLIKLVLLVMRKQNSGHILSTISTAGASDTEAGNNENWMAYGATKWAMTGYLKALTKSLESSPIRVTAFMPGGFESDLYETAGSAGGSADFHNQPWMMKTDDVANTALFCLTRPADVQVEKIIITKK